jgi:glutamyl-Q tRNA(Asp) synthetase
MKVAEESVLPSQPIFRFAPSPNGYLHLGHAYSVLFTERAAKGVRGTMLLRIEDIDIARCKPEYENAIIEDLIWLETSWPEPVWRQSDRFAAYQAASEQLGRMGLLYPCFCSRAEIAKNAEGNDPDGAPLYPGTCRHLSKAEATRRIDAGEPVQWRLKMDEAQESVGDVLVIRECPVTDRDVRFERGQQRAAEPERWGDVVLVRKDTPTSYHLSVVVDDAEQGVSHVTRGMDLFAATDIHVLLQALLGLPSPVYAHHGLITDAEDLKLSKSAGAPALRDLRAAGWTPAMVRRRLDLED